MGFFIYNILQQVVQKLKLILRQIGWEALVKFNWNDPLLNPMPDWLYNPHSENEAQDQSRR